MKNSILFIENSKRRQKNLIALAERAKMRGFSPILIKGDLVEDISLGLFERVFSVSSCNLDELRKCCDEIDKSYVIKSCINPSSSFCNGQLVAAHTAMLAKERGLVHHSIQALYQCNNKYLMREKLGEDNFALVSSVEMLMYHAQRIGYPIILKPLTGVSSHLILQCKNDEDAIKAFRTMREKISRGYYQELYVNHSYSDFSGKVRCFSPQCEFLIEKYLYGTEVTVECVVTENEIFMPIVHEKLQIREGERVVYEDILITPPSSLDQKAVLSIRSHVERVVRMLGVQNTFLHVELRYDHEKGPQLIEVNHRLGGGMIYKSWETFAGIDPYELELDLMLGQCNFTNTKNEISSHGMLFFFPPKGGVVHDVQGVEKLCSLRGMLHVEQTFSKGSIIPGDDEECFLVQCWMKADSASHIQKTYEAACKILTFNIGETSK